MTQMHPEVLSFERLLDWLEGRLPPEEAAEVAQQVEAGDAQLQATVAWLRAFLHTSQHVKLPSPPQALHQQLIERFKQHMDGQPELSLVRRYTATPMFDRHIRLPMAGMDAASANASRRQIIYSTTVADVVLHVHPRDGRSSINGQVLLNGAWDANDLIVQMIRDDADEGITMTDELGEFAFAGVAPGIYELVVSADTFEIEIEAMNLTQ